MDFPAADEMLNEMLRAAQEPNALVRCRLGDRPWTYMPGGEFKRLLDGELPETLTVDSVVLPDPSSAFRPR